jgi:hypothetical protein
MSPSAIQKKNDIPTKPTCTCISINYLQDLSKTKTNTELSSSISAQYLLFFIMVCSVIPRASTSRKFIFPPLNYRSFGLLGVWTWGSAYITNEEVHPKSSKGHMHLLPSALRSQYNICDLTITCFHSECNAWKRI